MALLNLISANILALLSAHLVAKPLCFIGVAKIVRLKIYRKARMDCRLLNGRAK